MAKEEGRRWVKGIAWLSWGLWFEAVSHAPGLDPQLTGRPRVWYSGRDGQGHRVRRDLLNDAGCEYSRCSHPAR